MGLFETPRSEEEQAAYESFMSGFRAGYPVEDENPTIDENGDEDYQRGLMHGQAAKADADAKARPWWKVW